MRFGEGETAFEATMRSMNEQLKTLLDKAKVEVAQSPHLGLSFKTRQAILREMGPVCPTGTLGPGLIRRARLDCAITKPALPIWEAHYDSKDPHRMIQLAEQYLAGGCSFDDLWGKADAFRGGLDTSDTPDKNVAYQVGRGSVCAAYVAGADELLQADQGIPLKELENPEDPDHWDCAYWIAGAQAGGMPWEDPFDKAKYGQFWYWYLNVAVPEAWASVPE